ncbi:MULTISPECIES: class I SAM-dependent methyltransferase [unclassified Curtobacterium]|uniref:class I SAM-dependent methyltransferase n=1 Tax=unclassified Curtobacterium TaxID=257496 RepID=UPI000D890DF6|nr:MULTISPECIES: methyltransferase domain-containing protein [unclassified Curtobacterium]PYY41422.1 SAM-dependent methyltransferase [Curtobacterium sp. MCPF17_046]WIB15461.1 methyltransferase domain-containing protein [Curtobacterium sp. MCPF17_050]
MTRTADGSAGDADYGTIGDGYTRYRRPEPSFERAIRAALGQARTVLNVGAGAGSYEPRDREVTAVEPSATMRAQRPGDLPEAVDASAEDLPFADDAFDAAMATFSVHQWSDLDRGLAEVRRVTRGPVVLLTCDPTRVEDLWLAEYAPEVMATEARRYPSLDRITAALGGDVTTTRLPIPFTCVDGFSEAYYGRPERLLDPGARKANSAWAFVDEMTAARSVNALRTAIEDGSWDARHGRLRVQPSYEGSLVLVVARP